MYIASDKMINFKEETWFVVKNSRTKSKNKKSALKQIK